MAERDIGKACGLISNREADSLCTQQTKRRVESYFSGELTDSIEDLRCKKLLDEKVGSLIGMNTTEVARGAEMVEQHRNRIQKFISENPNNQEDHIKDLNGKIAGLEDKIEKLREKIEDKNATERDAAAAKDEKDDDDDEKKDILAKVEEAVREVNEQAAPEKEKKIEKLSAQLDKAKQALERQVCLEVFTEPHAVSHLLNIRYAAYTNERLSSIDEASSTRDFDVCNLTRLPVCNKVQLLRRLLDIFNCELPQTCTPMKAYDLTLKQSSYDEDEIISVSNDIWRWYLQVRRTRKAKPTNRRGLMQCIAALAKELFGKRFLEKTETSKRKKGGKKVYNYKTNTAILNIAMKIMAWQDRQEDIDPEFVRLYGPYIFTLG